MVVGVLTNAVPQSHPQQTQCIIDKLAIREHIDRLKGMNFYDSAKLLK